MLLSFLSRNLSISVVNRCRKNLLSIHTISPNTFSLGKHSRKYNKNNQTNTLQMDNWMDNKLIKFKVIWYKLYVYRFFMSYCLSGYIRI